MRLRPFWIHFFCFPIFLAAGVSRGDVEKFTISRDDSIYECFPDLARADDGTLICVYRESDSHSAREAADLVYRLSRDGGETWREKKVLARSRREGGTLEKWNCPRAVRLRDRRLALLCDRYPVPPGEGARRGYSKVFLWFSEDGGESFSPPRETPISGIVPDRIRELPDGAWLIATHQFGPDLEHREQSVYRSEDRGETWQGPFTVASKRGLQLCEASILLLDGGKLVAYLRENSGKGWPAHKSFSTDGGRTWEGPHETLLDGCHRPVTGLLESGKVLITYRHRPIGGGSKNVFAFLEPQASALETDRSRQRGILLPLDHDRHPQSDSGYTGWVQLPGGRILAVNYIKDDAPMAYIRGYRFREDDF